MNPSRQGILKAAGLITVLTLLSRVMGLLRKLAQSWAMSDGSVATAYDTANTVPNVLFEIAAGGALAGAVIPLVSGFIARSMRAEASRTASALISWVLLIGLPVAGIVALAARPLSLLLFGNDADPAIVELATSLLRMFAVQIPLYGLSVVLSGILQAHKKFVLPALSPLLSSLVVITVFLAYSCVHRPDADPAGLSYASIAWLGWGTTAGVIVFSLPQLIPVLRLMDIRPQLRFPAGVARRTLSLTGAGLGALLAQQIAIIVIMIVANTCGGVGAYNTFNYAWAMFMVPYAVLAVPIATVTFPKISAAVSAEQAQRNHSDSDACPGAEQAHSSQQPYSPQQSYSRQCAPRVSELIACSTRLVCAMGMIACAMLIVLSAPARIVLEMGRSIEGLDLALIAMAIGVGGYSLMYHGARILYACERGVWVIISNSVGWGCVVLGLVCTSLWADGRIHTVLGIGISMSAGLTVGAIAVLASIAHVSGKGSIAGVARTCAVHAGVQACVGIPAWFAVHGLLHMMGTGMVGAVVSAIAGASILIVGAACTMWVCDRDALRALR